MRLNIGNAQMNAVGSCGKRDVRARINQEARRWRMLAHEAGHFPCQSFQFSRAQISFAELYIVDAGTRGFGDFGEQGATAGSFVARKLTSVGDVIEEAAVRHQLSAYYETLLKLCGADTPFGFAQGRLRPRKRVAQSRIFVTTGSCRAALGLDSRGRAAVPTQPLDGRGARPHTGATDW